MNQVKQHATKILMVSILGFGLYGCGLGSICDSVVGTTTTVATVVGTTNTPATTSVGGVAVKPGDSVTTPSSLCGK